MQLESHATPPQETPQQRYATLHRAIERGLDSDEIWRELADVSLKLGHNDEAIACLRRIRNSAIHKIVESHLQRTGILQDPASPRPAQRRQFAAAARGKPDDGPTAGPPGLKEHVADAVQYLFHQHMPWLVLVTTLAFPILVGLGGFLTVGGSPLLLAAIAAIPGICVVAVVGAMGRQILLASSGGSGDVPSMPELGQLIADARRFLADTGLVLGTLIVPSVAAIVLGVPLGTALPCLAVGAFFAPIAWALRQLRGDFAAISPVTLLRAVARGGPSYFGLVPVCWLLFAPAAIIGVLIFGRPVWVQVAAIGPLGVVPLFVISRLLGTWLDTKKVDLAGVLLRSKGKAAAPAEAEQIEEPAAAPRGPRRPEALENFEAPKVKRPVVARQSSAPAAPAKAPAQAQAKAPAKAPPRAAAAPATHQQQPVRHAATPQARPAPAAGHAAPPQSATRAIEGRSPGGGLDDQPDLTRMPGAVVLTGSERQLHGAAARTRH